MSSNRWGLIEVEHGDCLLVANAGSLNNSLIGHKRRERSLSGTSRDHACGDDWTVKSTCILVKDLINFSLLRYGTLSPSLLYRINGRPRTYDVGHVMWG